MLEEELERERLEVWFVEMRAFVIANAASVLDDELERETLDVWFAAMFELASPRAPSPLEDCCERLFEVALIAARRASTLEDEFETFRLEA